MGSTIDFLSDPKLQGLLALITIVQIVVALLKDVSSTIRKVRSSWSSIKDATRKPLSNLQLTFDILRNKLSAMTILSILGYFALGWFFYSLPWISLTVAFKWQFMDAVRMAASLSFVFLSASVLLGGFLTRPRQNTGYFLGGGISLGVLAVYLTYTSPSMVETTSRQAWFLICMIIGGMFGLFAGTLTTFTVNLFHKNKPIQKEPVREAEVVQE